MSGSTQLLPGDGSCTDIFTRLWQLLSMGPHIPKFKTYKTQIQHNHMPTHVHAWYKRALGIVAICKASFGRPSLALKPQCPPHSPSTASFCPASIPPPFSHAQAPLPSPPSYSPLPPPTHLPSLAPPPFPPSPFIPFPCLLQGCHDGCDHPASLDRAESTHQVQVSRAQTAHQVWIWFSSKCLLLAAFAMSEAFMQLL